MPKGLRAAAMALLALSMALPGRAEEADFAFGGRGEDALYEAVSTGDGLFAVGRTASSDGDLASRTRTGETGWAIRIDESGKRLWNFCSAKSGMFEMTAPHAHADGTFSLVLTDETRQRGEWIVLDARGRQTSRVAIPAPEALCPQQKPGRIAQMIPVTGASGPYLALLLTHEDGELCCAALFPDGGAMACGAFYGDVQGVLRADERRGALLHLGADLGALAVTRLAPGVQPESATVLLSLGNAGLARVTDALIDGDGSVVLCAQTLSADQKAGGLLVRLNAEGDPLFARDTGENRPLSLLTETDTGYAACAGERVLFFDEDGVAQGEARTAGEPLDLVRGEGGVLQLTHLPERGARQAAFTRIAQPVRVETAAPEETATPAPRSGSALPFGEGHLLCEGGYGGVTVSCVDAAGQTLWQTRTPIHTAADRLVWESAQRTDGGDILLTGRYETDTPAGVLLEGAKALLGADGVLREIRLINE